LLTVTVAGAACQSLVLAGVLGRFCSGMPVNSWVFLFARSKRKSFLVQTCAKLLLCAPTLPTRMKYRAVCPHCGVRFSRSLFILNVPHLQRECNECGNLFRAVAWSEYLGNAILILISALLMFLMLIGVVTFLAGSALLGAQVVLAIWLWPYVTIFEKTGTIKTQDGG
jgi:hypothetical protein